MTFNDSVQRELADPCWLPTSFGAGRDEIIEMLDELVAEYDALSRRKLADKITALVTASTRSLSSADFLRMQRQTLFILSAVIDEMPDCPEKYGVAYAIGSNTLAGRSMSEIAAKLGTTRALISHRAVDFCRRYQLPPSPYMKAAK